MSYVIAIANQKGGVAKTTTTVSLGAALAEGEDYVLLLDLDPQANLTLALGRQPGTLSGTTADLLTGMVSILDICQKTTANNLDLLPANQELSIVERYLDGRPDLDSLLRGILQPLASYASILIDCPPTLGTLTELALSAANLLVIPTQCELFSAHGLREMLNLVRHVRQKANPQLRYRLLLTMVDRRNRIHRRLEDQVRRAFGKAVFESAIELDTKLRESQVAGRPITVYDPNSRAAEMYRRLAQELRTYVQESVRAPQQSI